MSIFEHTHYEPRAKLWRGWFEDGQSVEVSWGEWKQLAFEVMERGLRISIPGLSFYCPHPWSVHAEDQARAMVLKS